MIGTVFSDALGKQVGRVYPQCSNQIGQYLKNATIPGELNHRDHDQSVAPKKINKRTDPCILEQPQKGPFDKQ